VLEGVVGGAVRDRARGALGIETVRELDNAARCNGQAPRAALKLVYPMTRSPGQAGYPGPMLSIIPANSSRREWEGWFGLILAGDDQGVEEIEANGFDFATISPGPATGSGMSARTRSSGVPNRWQRIAFMAALLDREGICSPSHCRICPALA
jgi:hypothetical protein